MQSEHIEDLCAALAYNAEDDAFNRSISTHEHFAVQEDLCRKKLLCFVTVSFVVTAHSTSYENLQSVQPNNWQTAFLEQYLNESGTERICDLYDVPKDELPYSHVAFFIYKVDAYVLRTPYGEFQLSSEMEVPHRLHQIIETDEDYM